ncbi:hypothetical protein KY362_06880 [Candidatus Woesearchaeota archaeon]|nr:hypothetical protein [Candidatus Woesearchaeota archaeon]
MHRIPDETVKQIEAELNDTPTVKSARAAERETQRAAETGAARDPSPARVSREAPEMINFKEEVIGYIEDELAQGYGLDQIEKGLLEQGYPNEIITFAADFVEKHAKVSQKDKEKEVPKTDEHHHKRRFLIPVMGVGSLIILLAAVFFIFGIGSGEAEDIGDVTLRDNLGLGSDARVSGSKEIYSRDEVVIAERAEDLLKQNKANPLLSTLEVSSAVTGFEKKASVHTVKGDGQKTLIEIRFQAEKDAETLKILESIPKNMATLPEIELTQGGVVAESDPILLFTFNNVKQGDVKKAVYVVNKALDTLDTVTFAAEESEDAKRSAPRPERIVCGDSVCMQGESYLTCCEDCGCMPGFECTRNRCVVPSQDLCRTDTDCDDGDQYTEDTCSGTPKTCTNTDICVSGDDECPAVCGFHELDTDCPPEILATEEELMAEYPPADRDTEITGPPESPEIMGLAVSPETVGIGGQLTVTATVTDANGKADISRVWFEVLELYQTHGELGDMNDLGQEGDPAAGDDVYTAKRHIGAHYLEGYYHLTVYAEDRSGNKKKRQVQFQVSGEAGGAEDSSGTADLEHYTECKDNIDCMITAAQTCSAAFGTHTAALSGDGMVQQTRYVIEIAGLDSAGCAFGFMVESIEVSFTNDEYQALLDSGMTAADISGELAAINSEADMFEGEMGECVFSQGDLAPLLSMWKTEDLDVVAWDIADCTGSYFGETATA